MVVEHVSLQIKGQVMGLGFKLAVSSSQVFIVGKWHVYVPCDHLSNINNNIKLTEISSWSYDSACSARSKWASIE